MLNCAIAKNCSGCAWIDRPYEAQLREKSKELSLRISLPEPEMVSVGESGLRDRVDLTWQRDETGLRLGLYDRNEPRKIVDIASCPQLSPDLEAWLREFRRQPIPIVKKGSARLRVSPSGERGVWLDLSHVDTKALLDEAGWLKELLKNATVEMGQRHKPVIERNGRLGLGGEAEPKPWFVTFAGESLEPIPLFSVVGAFTQAGFSANRALVKAVLAAAGAAPGAKIIELFSGIGNFTVPLASLGAEVTAFEVDELALASFEKTRSATRARGMKIGFHGGNLYGKAFLPPLERFDVLVVDPPRSGLKQVLDHLEGQNQLPPTMVYVSCFAESMASDLARLSRLGYRVETVVGVDQFTQSPHCEWVVRLRKE